MGEGDLRYVARPPEHPAQVHQDPHAEDGAVAVAEHADGVDAREKDIKTVVSLPLSQYPCVTNVKTRCVANVEAPNANAPRLDDHHVDVGSRVGRRRSSWMSKKASSC